MRSITEAISEVNRELQVRIRCFPRWVSEGKLDETEAKDRIERLQSAKHYLEGEKERTEAAAANAMPTDKELEKKSEKGGLTGPRQRAA